MIQVLLEMVCRFWIVCWLVCWPQHVFTQTLCFTNIITLSNPLHKPYKRDTYFWHLMIKRLSQFSWSILSDGDPLFVVHILWSILSILGMKQINNDSILEHNNKLIQIHSNTVTRKAADKNFSEKNKSNEFWKTKI